MRKMHGMGMGMRGMQGMWEIGGYVGNRDRNAGNRGGNAGNQSGNAENRDGNVENQGRNAGNIMKIEKIK